ncbi:hypothetical protein [Streptomyces tremellae]|uniref:Uncharacterized protein n=1 Tax=Streptomyces tremellae TaxID=1124239 RepID=A0ABP7FKC9_9ACTN
MSVIGSILPGKHNKPGKPGKHEPKPPFGKKPKQPTKRPRPIGK